MVRTKLEKKFTVTREMLADRVGSGSLPVLATPVLSALFEGAAAELAGGCLEAGDTTVGTEITVRHTAPTPCGAEITVKAELTGREGRVFQFRLAAKDEAGPVASGEHARVAVHSARFLQKAEARKTTYEG